LIIFAHIFLQADLKLMKSLTATRLNLKKREEKSPPSNQEYNNSYLTFVIITFFA